MHRVLIKSTSDSAECSLGPLRGVGSSRHYRVVLRCEALSASVDVYDLEPQQHLVRFFSELGESWWSGWEDGKTYSSLEGHLVLHATRDTLGHIALRVTLHEASGTPDWTTSCTVEIDAGQLPEIAAAVREVFGKREAV